MTNPQRQTLQNLSRDLDLQLSEMPAAELGNLVHLMVKATNYVAVWRDIAADQEAATEAAVLEVVQWS